MKNKKTITIILIIISIMVILTILILLLKKNKISEILQSGRKTAQATVYTQIGELEFDITNLIEQNPVPTLSAGMIPVKPDGEYWTIVDRTDNTWFNYAKGIPAYMMLNDGTYQSEEYYQMPNSKKLAENNIGTQISEKDTETLGSIYVWVPRFAYTEDDEGNVIDVIYIKEECTVGGSYTMLDCFTYTEGETKLSLSGIWIEINELGSKTTTVAKVANMNQGESDTIYGFLSQTKVNEMSVYEKTATQIYLEYIDNLNENNVRGRRPRHPANVNNYKPYRTKNNNPGKTRTNSSNRHM